MYKGTEAGTSTFRKMKDPNVAEAQCNKRKVAKNEPDEVGKGQILQGPWSYGVAIGYSRYLPNFAFF